jgi:putative transposase
MEKDAHFISYPRSQGPYMRKSRFSERQILNILGEVTNGESIKDVCSRHRISIPTFYVWKGKYQTNSTSVDMPLSEELKVMRNKIVNLEKENDQLRRIYIELSLDRASIKRRERDRKTHIVA